jgi:hypothetical protein
LCHHMIVQVARSCVLCEVRTEAEETVEHRAYSCNATQRKAMVTLWLNKCLVYAPEMMIHCNHDDDDHHHHHDYNEFQPCLW